MTKTFRCFNVLLLFVPDCYCNFRPSIFRMAHLVVGKTERGGDSMCVYSWFTMLMPLFVHVGLKSEHTMPV